MSTLIARLAALTCAAAVLLAAASSAHAAFGVSSFGMKLHDPAGRPLLQAGGHPDVTTKISFHRTSDSGGEAPDGNVKTIQVDLPKGVIGNPTALPRCTQEELVRDGPVPACPVDSQAGIVDIVTYFSGFATTTRLPVYNMVPPRGVPGQFAFNVLGTLVFVNAEVRGNDYGLTARIANVSQALALGDTTLTLWGVPADPAHDAERYAVGGQIPGVPSTAPQRPLMTNPTSCTGEPLAASVRADSWQAPGRFEGLRNDRDTDGNPMVMTGCENLPFEPRTTVQPTSRRAGAPTGLEVRLSVPQNQNPDGVAAAHLRRAVVRFPAGMTVSPSSADGLGACPAAAIGLGESRSPSCPESSKLGSVEIETPLLEAPLKGSIYLAQPRGNPFGTLLAIYLVAEGSGVTIKLPGRIDADPATGDLTATFDDNPQQPFSALTLRFKDGPRAALVNPRACGAYRSEVELTSWASSTPVRGSDGFTIGEGCEAAGAFAPSMTAGLLQPRAGGFSSFVMDVRRDGGPNVAAIDVSLPPGLLATPRGVPLCEGAAAATGACPAASTVGSTTLAIGPGTSPIAIPQPGRPVAPVYLGGPYKGAPFSLVIKVPAQAGPFDLGTVVVRARIIVDPVDAHLRVISDPLPQVLEGIPTEYRRIRVTIDRNRFMRAPTSCAEKLITGVVTSVDDRSAPVASRFGATGCKGLKLAPKLRMSLTNKTQTAIGRHPGLKATLTMPAAGANLKRVQVELPLALALDPENSQSERLCEYEPGLRGDCPKHSIVGTATVRTPILNRRLTGPVHFVQGVRFDKRGRRIRTLPTLLVKLHGEVDLVLRARSSVKKEHLVTTFEPIPDAPISRFDLKLSGGKDGILVVTRKLCGRRHVAKVASRGQNGARHTASTRIATPCRASSNRRKAR